MLGHSTWAFGCAVGMAVARAAWWAVCGNLALARDGVRTEQLCMTDAWRGRTYSGSGAIRMCAYSYCHNRYSTRGQGDRESDGGGGH